MPVLMMGVNRTPLRPTLLRSSESRASLMSTWPCSSATRLIVSKSMGTLAAFGMRKVRHACTHNKKGRRLP